MPMRGEAALVFWNDIAAGGEDAFLAWHVSEHMPERLALPGFLRGRRYASAQARPAFFNFYEAQTADAFASSAYRARLDSPTPWTREVLTTFRDTSRTVCRVAATAGRGEGGWMETIRFAFPPDRAAALRGLAAHLAALPPRTPLVGAHLLEGEADARSAPQTSELALRGRPDERVDGVILVEAADRSTLARLAASELGEAALAELGVASAIRGTYQLQFSLSHGETVA